MGNIVVAHLGARMHYSVPEILHRSGLLSKFYTDLYSSKLGLPDFLGKKINAVKKFQGRTSAVLPQGQVVHFPLMGFNYAYRLRKAKSINEQLAAYIWAGKKFTKSILQDIDWPATKAFYGYNTASLEIFQAAKQRGIGCIYEQTIAPLYIERTLLRTEEARFPQWVKEKDEYDSELLNEMIEREKQEIELADHIAAGSEFVKDAIKTFRPGAEKKVTVIPYGVKINPSPAAFNDVSNQPLRILVAGTLGIRKGTPYVLELAKALGKSVEIRIVGNAQKVPEEILKEIQAHCDFKGLVPRSEMPHHYKWAQVFLLPSVCEGSATVTYEAMQYGLPLIVTPNTGAFIENEREGLIIPVGDLDAMKTAIAKMSNTEYRHSLHNNVLKACEKLSVEAYGQRLLHEMRKWGYFINPDKA